MGVHGGVVPADGDRSAVFPEARSATGRAENANKGKEQPAENADSAGAADRACKFAGAWTGFSFWVVACAAVGDDCFRSFCGRGLCDYILGDEGKQFCFADGASGGRAKSDFDGAISFGAASDVLWRSADAAVYTAGAWLVVGAAGIFAGWSIDCVSAATRGKRTKSRTARIFRVLSADAIQANTAGLVRTRLMATRKTSG